MRNHPQLATGATVVAAVALVVGLGASGIRSDAQAPGTIPIEVPLSLKTVPIPEPPNLAEFVRDKPAAIRLGKALFWDMQAGSDGVVACATCHFHAGADARLKNQLNPGPAGETSFHTRTGPNYTLKATDFPFHRLQLPDNRLSRVVWDKNDVVGSQGVVGHLFTGLNGDGSERGDLVADPVFFVGTSATRRVTPRNAPSVINAVFNHRNFWDGRAQHEFNGVNPFGDRDPKARVWHAAGNTLQPVRIRLLNASLASQAVGPPLNTTEMSWDGRGFRDLARKLLGEQSGVIPLGKQLVHPDDSVLGALANSRLIRNKPGLNTTYAEMIRQAFRPEWWAGVKAIQFDSAGNAIALRNAPSGPLPADTFTQMEANFSLFFGLAIQLYEATLVSDDTPFDRFLEGNTRALTTQERMGFQVFFSKGRCFNCHSGPEMTRASVTAVARERITMMPTLQTDVSVHDTGFFNIGVRPSGDDPGVGGTAPPEFGGEPLADSRRVERGFLRDPLLQQLFHRWPPHVAVDGAFKTPGLRNVELTAPYFHNGGQATLAQVVEFYNRGGDFTDENAIDVNAAIQPLRLTSTERLALTAFLKALTDPRVRFEKAPFDHPQLFIPLGHAGNEGRVLDDGSGKAVDLFREIRAVGAGGGAGLQPVFPQ